MQELAPTHPALRNGQRVDRSWDSPVPTVLETAVYIALLAEPP